MKRIFVLLLAILSCISVKADSVFKQIGEASWYGKKHHGRKTASGSIFNQFELTCAHRFLPFGTFLKVTTQEGLSVIVKVTDRGPYAKKRIVDLSYAAAKAINIKGVAKVTLTRIMITPLPALPEIASYEEYEWR